MKIKNHINLSRLIGKIDNDFNISESDWIPRVAAWTIDALAQIKCLPMELKRRKLEVNERIAQYPCDMNMESLRVFDENGCEIFPIGVVQTDCCGKVELGNKKGFVLQGNCIELNFEAKFIEVETYAVATYYDEYYECDVPYIYDDGLLLEALAWYCLFKYLSRGSHHQVYSLTSPNQVINPFIQWNNLRMKAATSVKIKISNDLTGWNNFFFNSTFRPRG